VTAVNHRPATGSRRVLGSGRGAALLRPNGEIDWWCPNRFEATPVLWRLLDERGGFARWLGVELATWDGQPAGPTARSVLRHEGALIETWDGLLVRGPGSVLIRLARSRGPSATLVHELRRGGFDASATQVPAYTAHFEHVSISADRWNGIVIPAGLDDAELPSIAEAVRMMHSAEADQDAFLDRVPLPHDHPSRATDALRVLCALTDADSGAPVASVTTSLPEVVGGSRQFDYRFSWLRDSAYACATAALLGRRQASADYLEFIGRVLDRFDIELPPLVTSSGDPTPAERTVEGIVGWGGSRPVRVGNDAAGQCQLDSVSTVIESISVHIQCGGRMTPSTWGLLEQLTMILVDAPFGPSNGIWEGREPRRLVTEELARWIGLDKAIRLRLLCRPWLARPSWQRARAAARQRIDAAFDERTGMLPQSFDGPFVADAATLLAAIHGLVPRRSEQSRRLVLATIDALGEGPFLRRYPPTDDGFEGVEGAFLPASWWAVSALAAAGELEAARCRADQMCAQLPPLLPEQWSVDERVGAGNTPLLWSHTEAARALYNLQVAGIRHRYGLVGAAAWRVGRYVRLRLGRGLPRPAYGKTMA
jgi:hypothetical protein